MKKSPYRRISNRVLHLLARFLPGAAGVRPLLHRLRGVKVGENVFIGDDVYLENEYPEAVEIQSGVRISVRAVILAHANGAGRIVIEKNAFIGPNALVLTSGKRTLRVGEGAIIGPGAVITKDVPANVFMASAPAAPVTSILAPATNGAKVEDSVLEPCPSDDDRNRKHRQRRGPVRLRHPVAIEPPIGVSERDKIRNSVFRAIERVKELSLNGSELTCEESTVLLGEGAAMDSMSFANFVVALEEEVGRTSDLQWDLVGVLSRPNGHLPSICTAGQLIDLIEQLMQRRPLS